MGKKLVDVAVAILINTNNQVLITKRNTKQSFAGYWEFPGGKLEYGELPIDAAIREVSEEVRINLDPAQTKQYAKANFELDDRIVNITYFKTTAINSSGTITDQLDMKWIAVEDLNNYNFPKANDNVIANLMAEYNNLEDVHNSKITSNRLQNITNTELVHNYIDKDGKSHKVLSTLVDHLLDCTSFKIVVAFITNSGVSLLLPTLIDLQKRGIRGQIITSTYLGFTEPEAIAKLRTFSNLTIYLNDSNLHSKGYIFEYPNHYQALIGSSNLTASALTTNSEWNTLSTHSYEDDSLILESFEQIQNQSSTKGSDFELYENQYKTLKAINKTKQRLYETYIIETENNSENASYEPITANTMQRAALKSLENLRSSNIDKGLVISSTGSGKTILAALDAKQANPNRLLFIVHRENIARKAMETFKALIPDKTYGLYTGMTKDPYADYIFATIQSLVNNLDEIKQIDFDYVIIDEVHHGGAPSYQEVFKQIKPKFYLGLTATPERSDGFNIFEMFDYNIAYEYRLDRAMEDKLLAPFHYFGVSDITIDNKPVDDKTTINDLTSNERIKNIIHKLKEYTTVKPNGLMFVSNVNEAKELSNALNQHGFKTISLDSSNSEEERKYAIDHLHTDKLDYIITVDIFNEGIDIPAVNQVVLLRPTKSAIIYIQQIGRGLRKHKGKEYVTIIDFIGNYKNNYLVPVAIANDHSYNKDVLKKDVIVNGITALVGESVIQFEQIVQEQLIKQITNTKISTMAKIKQDYNYLKAKLNRIPMLDDFYQDSLISPLEITKLDIYPNIINRIEKEQINFTKDEQLYLEYLSKYVLPSKRNAENIIISMLLEQDTLIVPNDNQQLRNAADHLSKQIFTKISDEYKFRPLLSKQNSDTYQITPQFKASVQNVEFKTHLVDILKVNRQLTTTATLNNKTTYTRKEAYKYLLKDFNNGYQVGGYTVFDDIALIFITLDDSNSFTNYDNELLNNKQITWFSKANRKLIDKENNLTAEGKLEQNKVDIHIFTKRNSSEEFYYLGTATTSNIEKQQIEDKHRYKYTFNLNKSINKELYKYLTTKGD